MPHNHSPCWWDATKCHIHATTEIRSISLIISDATRCHRCHTTFFGFRVFWKQREKDSRPSTAVLLHGLRTAGLPQSACLPSLPSAPPSWNQGWCHTSHIPPHNRSREVCPSASRGRRFWYVFRLPMMLKPLFLFALIFWRRLDVFYKFFLILTPIPVAELPLMLWAHLLQPLSSGKALRVPCS